MTEPALMKRKDLPVPALAMANRFQKYAPETEKVVRKAEVIEDATLKALKGAYETLVCSYPHEYFEVFDETYDAALKLPEGIGYNQEDVMRFCIALSGYQARDDFSKKTGLFLSALVNTGLEDSYVILTSHLSVPIHDFGYSNIKHITIEGDIGKLAGLDMRSGSILVKGNAESHVGFHMQGGKIIVEGDSGFGTGSQMNGGTIIVKGNAGYSLGGNGGEIYVDGEIGSLGGGRSKVFQKGKPVVRT